jgi:hypothetical protein
MAGHVSGSAPAGRVATSAASGAGSGAVRGCDRRVPRGPRPQPGEPLIARLPTDPVAPTELRHVVELPRVVSTKRRRSSMGEVSCQGMDHLLLPVVWTAHVSSVTNHPGLFCYQSTRFVPSRSITSCCTRQARCSRKASRLIAFKSN